MFPLLPNGFDDRSTSAVIPCQLPDRIQIVGVPVKHFRNDSLKETDRFVEFQGWLLGRGTQRPSDLIFTIAVSRLETGPAGDRGQAVFVRGDQRNPNGQKLKCQAKNPARGPVCSIEGAPAGPNITKLRGVRTPKNLHYGQNPGNIEAAGDVVTPVQFSYLTLPPEIACQRVVRCAAQETACR